MKNIKLSYEDVLDEFNDIYTEIDTVKYFPKRQGMKKVIQRGMNDKVDFYDKDNYFRKSDNNYSWYYAKHLLKVHGQSVGWALRRFKRKFPNFYDLKAFKYYFEDLHCEHINPYWVKNRKRENHVYDGIITRKQEIPRKITYRTPDYKVIYWDPYGLVEVNESEYNDYNSYVNGIFRPTDPYWYKESVKENFVTQEKFIRAYPFGIEMITKGERFEVNYNSKEERSKRFKTKIKSKTYNFRHLSEEEKLFYDDILKTSKKKSNKKKRRKKEDKTFETSLNHSLHNSLEMLKLMDEKDLMDDLILRLNFETLSKIK